MEKAQEYIKYIELVAWACSLLAYFRSPGKVRMFIAIIMAVVVFTDWGGYSLKLLKLKGAWKYLWFNILVPVQLCLWSYFILSDRLLHSSRKKALYYIPAIYLCIAFLMALLVLIKGKIAGYGSFLTPVYSAGVILLSIICFRYLYKFVNSNQIMQKWYHSILFIVFGLLIFYLGTLPFHTMRSYLYYNFPHLFDVYYSLFIILNFSLYIIISLVTLCMKEK